MAFTKQETDLIFEALSQPDLPDPYENFFDVRRAIIERRVHSHWRRIAVDALEFLMHKTTSLDTARECHALMEKIREARGA